MAFRDEVILPGGIYWQGDDLDGDRLDVSIQGVGTGEEGNPHTLNLHLTTGMGTICLCEIAPQHMLRLGRWIIEISKEKMREIKSDQ